MTAAASLRLVVAVHGYEVDGWARETCRVVSAWTGASIRVLAVLDVPSPSFTSLTPYARRAYDAARAGWTQLETTRLQGAIDALLPELPAGVEVVRVQAARGDLARTIVTHAHAWPADIVVVGGPAPGLRTWFRAGALHQHVLRRARCTVIVPASPRITTPRTGLVAVSAAGAGR